MASARRALLRELSRVAADWAEVLPALALELLTVPRERWAGCAGVPRMIANLTAEREAVAVFVDAVTNEVRARGAGGHARARLGPWGRGAQVGAATRTAHRAGAVSGVLAALSPRPGPPPPLHLTCGARSTQGAPPSPSLLTGGPLQVLTPLQEAQLEVASYPWCPE